MTRVPARGFVPLFMRLADVYGYLSALTARLSALNANGPAAWRARSPASEATDGAVSA